MFDSMATMKIPAYAKVRIPNMPGKITFSERDSGAVYVLLQYDRVYDPKRKFNIAKRVLIGRVADGEAREWLYPNKNFPKYFPDVKLSPLFGDEPKPQVKSETQGKAAAEAEAEAKADAQPQEKTEHRPEPPRARSNVQHAGSFIVIENVAKTYGLPEMMQKSFGEKSGIMLDFAQYMVIAGENAAQHFPAFARDHILFNKDMRVYSDSTLSRVFSDITKDQIIDFLDSWNEKQDHESRIYVSYDSTNKNTQAGDIDFAEFGHAKDDPKTPIVNIGVGYDTNNRVPLFYETYPGSIPDVNQLKHMIDKAKSYNYENIGIILDRGYFSKSNIEYMDEKGYQFLMMVKGCKPLVSELIKDNYGTFEDNRKYIIGDTGLHGITIQRHLYEGDQKMRYFHLVFSPEKMLAERREFERELKTMAVELQKVEQTDTEIGEPYKKYFDCRFRTVKGSDGEEKQVFLYATENTEATTERLRQCGYFCLISSEQMPTERAYDLYKGRDASEKLFRADKTALGAGAMRVHSNEAMETKTLVEFVALIIRNRIYNLLKDEMRRLPVRKNFMTVPAAMRELEKIEMTRRNGNEYQLDFTLTKTQKAILRSFGLDEEEVKKRTAAYRERLRTVDDRIQPDNEAEDEEDAQAEKFEDC